MILVLLLAAGCAPQPRFPAPAVDLMARLDADGSGDLAALELRGFMAPRVMGLFDHDKDQILSLDELEAMMARVGTRGAPDSKAKAKAKAKAKGKHKVGKAKRPIGPPPPDAPQP